MHQPLVLKEQGIFIELQKNRSHNFVFKGVFSKIGTIIKVKLNILHIRSI